MAERSSSRRLRAAAALVAVGLAVEAISLYGSGPGAFLSFALVGATLTIAGSALATWTLLTSR